VDLQIAKLAVRKSAAHLRARGRGDLERTRLQFSEQRVENVEPVLRSRQDRTAGSMTDQEELVRHGCLPGRDQ